MKPTSITIPNKLYGDKTHKGYAFEMTVGETTFDAVVYKRHAGSWGVSLPNAAHIADGKTRAGAISAAQKRLDALGEDRVKFSLEMNG